ncbi:MAG: hypothetical protein ACREOJ_18990 [Gemmatimonadaceae bacterium]
MLTISHWRPANLFAAWGAYWAGLAAVTLTPTALAILRATSGGAHPSSANASLGDKGISVTVTEAGRQTFIASAHLLPVALWIAVPPLTLFALWAWRRSRALARPQESTTPAALGVPAPDFAAPPSPKSAPSPLHSRSPHA